MYLPANLIKLDSDRIEDRFNLKTLSSRILDPGKQIINLQILAIVSRLNYLSPPVNQYSNNQDQPSDDIMTLEDFESGNPSLLETILRDILISRITIIKFKRSFMLAQQLELKSEFFSKFALSSLEIVESFFREPKFQNLVVKNDLDSFKKFIILSEFVFEILKKTDPRDKGEQRRKRVIARPSGQ